MTTGARSHGSRSTGISERSEGQGAPEGRDDAFSGLSRIGFSQPEEVTRRLAAARGEWPALLGADVEDFAVAADPDEAFRLVLELIERAPDTMRELWLDPHRRELLLRVCGGSIGLGEFLARVPEALADIGPAAPFDLDEDSLRSIMESAVAGRAGDCGARALRVAYRRLLVRLVAGDLGSPDPLALQPSVSSCLSRMASAVLDAALLVSRRDMESDPRFHATPAQIDATRLAIVGMGKAGAGELNYVSDVDVIFVADTIDESVTSRDQAVTIATRWAGRMMSVVAGPGVEPPLWEVDANLRPEGRAGALVRTLASHLAYYARWAKGWEFQALVKARTMAGDRALGESFEAGVRPRVWSVASLPDFVPAVRHMRERVTGLLPADEAGRQVKLGPGGLRDVEFTVQLLQLVHGQHDDRVRQRATLPALAALAECGYVGMAEAAEFAECYKTLRVIEHRLQLRRLHRTHLIPDDPEELRIVARGTRLVTTADALQDLWQSTRARVRELHERLFYRPLLDAVATLPEEDVALTTDQASDRLRALGFRDPRGALSHIAALTAGVSRKVQVQRTLMPVMLEWLADGVDPDYGLLAFRRVSDRLGDTPWFLRTLRDSSGALDRLTRALSGSRFIGNLLERIPEAIAWFGDDDALLPRAASELEAEGRSILDRHASDREGASSRIMAVRRRETLRLAIATVAGRIDEETLGKALSDIGTMVLRGLLALIDPERREGIEFGVIAMGRFGGRELGFASDIDAIYVYRALPGTEPVAAEASARRVAEELTQLSEDLLLPLDIDLDLRPEGRNGPLVRTLEAYERYYARWSALWEAQALLRAAPVAGSARLLADMSRLIDRVRYPAGLDDQGRREILRVKARVESERLPRGADPRRHLKLGRGTVTDVEWLVQLLQLEHAHDVPALRTTSTRRALEAIADAGLLPAGEVSILRAAWALSSRIRSAATLFRGRGLDELPTDQQQLEGISRLLGYPAGKSVVFENDFLRATRRARAVFEREFYRWT